MSRIAIPTAPTASTVESDATKPGSSRPDGVDGQFDATLRQAQPQRDAPRAAPAAAVDAKHAHAPAAADPPAAHDESGKPRTRHPRDKHKHDQPTAQPAATAAAVPATPVPAAAPARQSAAADGKPLPANPPSTTGAIPAPATPGRTASTAATGRAEAAQAGAIRTAGSTTPVASRRATTAHAAPPPAVPAAPDASAESAASAQPVVKLVQAKFGQLASDKGGATPVGDGSLGNLLTPLVHHITAPLGGSAPNGQAPVQLMMQATPGQPQFVQETTQQVAWLVGNHIQQAQIQLNPRALGPIHIDIRTHHDHVDVSFAVQNPQTAQALQQTLPHLHEMLAQQGLNLGQASVGQQAPGQQHAPPVAYPDARWRRAEIEVPAPARTIRAIHHGRVDDFA